MSIADISIKRPVFIVMIIFSILTLGFVGYTSLPVDLLPSVENPNLVVVSNYQGASSDEMETLVTKPLENTLGTVEGLDTISSSTREGVSQISVAFKLGTDIKFAELKVREKVEALLPRLPKDMAAPSIRRFSTEDIPIMRLSLKGNRSSEDLTDIINNIIQPKIEATEGVGGINVMGGRDKIIKVTIDKSLLLANGLTYGMITNAINLRNVSMPVGMIQGSDKNITVRVYGIADSINDIGEINLTTKTGKIIRIKDIAKVEIGTEDETSRSRVDGQRAVMFAIYKQSGENTIKVADNVRSLIAPPEPTLFQNISSFISGRPFVPQMSEMQKVLPSDVSVSIINDSSLNIKRSISGVQEDILFGAILAIIIVWLFLGNFRSTIITALALPNSLLGAFFLVFLAGFTINTMTLLSLSLAVGLLIDDSIVVRENIFRHIELGEKPKIAAVNGTNEVGLAVLSTTLSILAVFIPISFLQGATGQFFRQFGLTVAFALCISLLDAFTSAPMLSAYWFKKTDENPKGIAKLFSSFSKGWNSFYDILNNIYKKILQWSLNHKIIVVLSVSVLFLIVIYFSRYIGQNYMNYTDNGTYSIDMEVYPGAALDKVDYYAKDIENFLKKQKDIEAFDTSIGQGQQSHTGSIDVIMKPLNKRKISTLDMVKLTRDYIRSKFDKYLIYRVNEDVAFGGIGGGGGRPITLNVYGPDLKVLQTLSLQISKILSETPGATDINSTLKPGTPELVIKLDSVKAEKMGITASELGNTLRDLIQGTTVSTYSAGENNYDIVLRLDQNQRNTVNDFKNMTITTKAGKKVLLSSFTTLTYSSAPLEIRRESNQRVVRITGNIAKGNSLTKVIAAAKDNLSKNIIMPSGYRYDFVGQQKSFSDLIKQIMMALALALLFMYMILASLYNSFIQPFYLMLSIPLAIIGSFVGLILTGIDLDLYGYIGILLVFGLVAKNAILLIDFTNKQRKENGMSIRDALIHAGPIRLRPILMTTFAMIFGMLPLALGLNEGSSGRQAMPVTVIGGLITSTFLTLVVVPIVYEWMESILEKRRLNKPAEED
jgi:hydrophobic/amphiphilic exporter-1 (mainly G- bacteria), HAE1 family